MTKIVASKHGNVTEEQFRYALRIIEETLERLQPHNVQMIDVIFFENSSQLRDYFSKEKMRYNILDNFDSEFLAMHDAWSGLPRISLCIERLSRLDDLVATGTIRHEVGHSALHGSLQYYIFQTTPELVNIQKQYRLTPEYARGILYLTAIAVKDYEVTNLLYARGYDDDLVAYVKTLLKPSQSEVLSWQLVAGHVMAESLYVCGRMKDLLCSAPLMKLKPDLRVEAEMGLSYFGSELSTKIMTVVRKLTGLMKGSTHENVETALDIICRELVKEILDRPIHSKHT
jgi:hypothetical protein